MKKIVFVTILLVLVSSLGCSPDTKCGGGSGVALCKEVKMGDASENGINTGNAELALPVHSVSGYDLVGQSLLSYPDLESVEDDFEMAMFEANQNRSEEMVLPIYEINVDNAAINRVLTALKRGRSATVDHQSDEIQDVFRMDKVKVAVNKKTGRVVYVDLEKDHHGPDVEKLDKRLMLEKAEEVFKRYIPEDLLKNTYFYRYAEYTNSAVVRDGDVVTKPYAAAVALNPVVQDIPVIGSGGKYSVHVESDGTVSSFDLQLSRFTPTDKHVKVMDASEAIKELKKRLEADGISLEDHFIKYSKFGYNYSSAKGKVKWLVPSYSFIIHPKEGVTDFGRVYTFPASHDAIAQQLFDEDVNSEVARKATQIDEESARLTPKE